MQQTFTLSLPAAQIVDGVAAFLKIAPAQVVGFAVVAAIADMQLPEECGALRARALGLTAAAEQKVPALRHEHVGQDELPF